MACASDLAFTLMSASAPLMKISLRHALGILLLAPTFLDAQDGAKYYKVDAVTPDGIVVRHAGGVEWVDAPLSDSARRERILCGLLHGFLKAFKEEEGMTPGAYRKCGKAVLRVEGRSPGYPF